MKNSTLPIVSVLTVLFSAQYAAGSVISSPVASVSIDNLSTQLPAGYYPGSPKSIYFGQAPGSIGNFGPIVLGEVDGGRIYSYVGVGNTDPFISFSVGVVDTGVGSNFSFLFQIPLAPTLAGQYDLQTFLRVLPTATSLAPASIAPLAGNTNLMISSVGTCSAGVDIGTGYSTPAGTNTQEDFSANGTFTASPGCDSTMTVLLAFAGSGIGATYDISGSFSLTPSVVQAPEPSSAVLIAAGLLGLAATVSRGCTTARART